MDENKKTLFYSNVYGTTFISPHSTWDATLTAYTNAIKTEVGPDDSDFDKNKKGYFKKELAIMRAVDYLPSLQVRNHHFGIDRILFLMSFGSPRLAGL